MAKTLRADARRNRERLLDAATAEFTERGSAASLEAIAKRAGVGIGTLYRHFPTREDLVVEAYRAELESLGAAADELLASVAPDEALTRWVDHFIGYATTKRGMMEVLQSSAQRPDPRAQLVGSMEKLLAAGAAAGTIRSDVDAEDVLRAAGGMWHLPDDDRFGDDARRILGLVLDGLRYGASENG